MLTLRKKHKRHGDHYFRRRYNSYYTTSFDRLSACLLSSHRFVPVKAHFGDHKQTSVKSFLTNTDTVPVSFKSSQSINLNLAHIEQLKSFDIRTNKRIPGRKLLTSSDTIIKNCHQIEFSSFESSPNDSTIELAKIERQIYDHLNDAQVQNNSILVNRRLSS